jgi:hypothetical protein
MFLWQLTIFKSWLLRGATDSEHERITRALAGMHWSAQISHKDGNATEVRWHDCGFEPVSLCMLPQLEPSIFGYSDDRFLRACGIRRPDDQTAVVD